MKYSLRHPPEGIPLLHLILWPWIWAQIVALKLWVRKHYGRGVPYRFTVSPLGRVRLAWLPTDLTWGYAANAPLLEPRFDFTAGIPRPALTRALTPEDTPRPPAPVLRTGTILTFAQRLSGALHALVQPPILDST
jgi:hypothetical protein